MTYKILCKQVELSEQSKEKILKKVKKLEKFFDAEQDCKISVRQQNEQMVVEITFVYKGLLIRGESRNRDLLTALDDCLDHIDGQIRKHKTKLAKKLRDDAFIQYGAELESDVKDEKEEFKIIKTKILEVKPMLPEEAILQMNMLGHDFFLLTNPETGKTNIVYKRKDGNYALIEAK